MIRGPATVLIVLVAMLLILSGCTREEATASLRANVQVDEFEIIHARFPCRSPDMHFFGYRFRIRLKDEQAQEMDKDYLLLKRAALGRPSGKWNDDDYDVLADGVVVGRIFKVRRLAGRTPWMWTLAFGHHEDRTPTHGYAATRGAAMAAFAKSWRRG